MKSGVRRSRKGVLSMYCNGRQDFYADDIWTLADNVTPYSVVCFPSFVCSANFHWSTGNYGNNDSETWVYALKSRDELHQMTSNQEFTVVADISGSNFVLLKRHFVVTTVEFITSSHFGII